MDKKGRVIAASGITFATAFDVGQCNEYDLVTRYKFSASIVKKFRPFLLKNKEAAKLLLDAAKNTKLTHYEANEVDYRSYSMHLKESIRHFNSKKTTDTPEFKKLSSAQQTILFSRIYQQGISKNMNEPARSFFNAAKENNSPYAAMID